MTKTYTKFSGILAAILLAAVIPSQLQAEARVDSNVIIGMYSGLAQLMDVHHPANPNGYGIVVILGSGWTAPLSPDARIPSIVTLRHG